MPAPDFELTVLGGLALSRHGEPVRAIGSRRLGLLAVLAASGPSGVSRDRLAGLFWPESDAERARAALKQVLYVFRRALDAELVDAGPAELRLDPAVVRSDVGTFVAALDAGDRRAAAGAYRGPFLDGVYIGQTPELERWVEETRARLASLHAGALAGLRDEALSRGAFGDALPWAERLVAVDRGDAVAARRLMEALAGTGNVGGALRVAEQHEAWMRAEFDLPPAPAVQSLAARLRSAPAPRPRSATGPASEQSSESVPVDARPAEPTAAAVEPTPPAPPGGPPRWWRSRVSRAALVATAAVLALPAVIGRSAGLRYFADDDRGDPWRQTAASAAAVRATVMPFRVVGDSASGDAGEVAAMLLATQLEGGAGVRVSRDHQAERAAAAASERTLDDARSLAAAAGSDVVVLGDLLAAGSQLHATVGVYRVRGSREPLAEALARGRTADLIPLVDSLAIQLLAARRAAEPGRLVHSAAGTTRSLEAFKAYLDGERHFRRGSYGDAIEAYRRATAIDSQFALAYYRWSVVEDWAAQGFVSDANARAHALADRLPARERLVVTARRAWELGQIVDAVRRLRRALELHPGDPEASYFLGEVIFHSGPHAGQAPADARPLFARVVETEPHNPEALAHLARVEVLLGRRAAADSLVGRVAALRPADDRLAAELRLMMWMAARRAGDRGTPPGPPLHAEEEALLYLGAWRDAAYTGALAEGERFARRLLARTSDPSLRMRARLRLAEYAMTRDDLTAALRELSDARLGPGWALAARAYHVALPFSGATPATLAAYADSLDRVPTPPPAPGLSSADASPNGVDAALADYPRALLALRLGDTTLALAAAGRLRAARDSLTALRAGLARSIEAEVAARAGQLSRAIGLLEESMRAIPLRHRLDVFGGFALQRFRRAELLAALGDASGALGAYEGFHGSDSAGDVAFHRAAALGRAAAYHALGRPADAGRERARAARYSAGPAAAPR